MDRISLWSALLVSYPEELLVVLITLAVAGYRDVLNFREKRNIVKLLLTVSLMVASSVIGRVFAPLITVNSIIQTIVFLTIITVIYRYKFVSCLIGLILSLSTLIGTEAIFGSLVTHVLHLSIYQVYPKLVVVLLSSLPDRIVQIVTFMIIRKKRDITFSMGKLSLNELIPIILYCLIIISSMFSIEKGFSVILLNKDISNFNAILLSLVINVALAVSFCSWLIYSIFKIREKAILKDKMHSFDLISIRNMLSEGQVSHVIELIDKELIGRECMRNRQ